MTPEEWLKSLSREERNRVCRDVLEQLSDYVEGTAEEDFCRQVEEMLGKCQPFDAYCTTLAATIKLASECGELPGPADEAYDRCVEIVRRQLAEDAEEFNGD